MAVRTQQQQQQEMALAPLDVLAKTARSFRHGPEKRTHCDAVLEAHRVVTTEQFLLVRTDVLDIELLNNLKQGTPAYSVVVQRGGAATVRALSQKESMLTEYTSDVARGAMRIDRRDDDTLIIDMASVGERDRGERKPEMPLDGAYSLALDGGSGAVFTGYYSLDELLATQARELSGRRKLAFVLRLPLTGMEAQREAQRLKLPIVELELRGKLRYSKGTMAATLRSVLLVVNWRPRMCDRFAPGTRLFVAPVSQKFLVLPEQYAPYQAPNEQVLPPATVRRLADELVLKPYATATSGVSAYSLYVSRNETTVCGYESSTDGKSQTYAMGSLTQLLTSAAVVRNALSRKTRLRTPEAKLYTSEALEEMLTDAGSTNVLAALRKIYGARPLPTLAQLLMHQSGMPVALDLSLGNLEGVIMGMGTTTAAAASAEEIFARELLAKCRLVGPAGGAYHVSPLNYAILMFVIGATQQQRDAQLANVLRSLGGANTDAAQALSHLEQGMYQLYSGAQLSAATLARVLTLRGWFAHASTESNPDPAAAKLDWLYYLAAAHTPVYHACARGKQVPDSVAAGFGPWLNRLVSVSPTRYVHINYAYGRHNADSVCVVLVPEYNASALLALRGGGNDSQSALCNATSAALTRLVCALVAGGSTDAPLPLPVQGYYKGLRMPHHSRASALARRAADATLRKEGTVAPGDKRLDAWMGVRFTALFESTTYNTLEVVRRSTSVPGQAPRYLIRVLDGNKHVTQTQEYLILVDPQMSADPQYAAVGAGAWRIVDPVTHALAECVSFELLRSGASNVQRMEPVVRFGGKLYVSLELNQQVRASIDPTSEEARVRAARSAEARKRRAAERKARRQLERATKKKAALAGDEDSGSDSDSSSSSDSSSDDDKDTKKSSRRIRDVFDALSQRTLAGGNPGDVSVVSIASASAHGRWEHWAVSNPRVHALRNTYAMPSGEPGYPLAPLYADQRHQSAYYF